MEGGHVVPLAQAVYCANPDAVSFCIKLCAAPDVCSIGVRLGSYLRAVCFFALVIVAPDEGGADSMWLGLSVSFSFIVTCYIQLIIGTITMLQTVVVTLLSHLPYVATLAGMNSLTSYEVFRPAGVHFLQVPPSQLPQINRSLFWFLLLCAGSYWSLLTPRVLVKRGGHLRDPKKKKTKGFPLWSAEDYLAREKRKTHMQNDPSDYSRDADEGDELLEMTMRSISKPTSKPTQPSQPASATPLPPSRTASSTSVRSSGSTEKMPFTTMDRPDSPRSLSPPPMTEGMTALSPWSKGLRGTDREASIRWTKRQIESRHHFIIAAFRDAEARKRRLHLQCRGRSGRREVDEPSSSSSGRELDGCPPRVGSLYGPLDGDEDEMGTGRSRRKSQW
ncbi:hypothetical protein JCM1841_001267 [Sporobolomyces salmonicolor]